MCPAALRAPFLPDLGRKGAKKEHVYSLPQLAWTEEYKAQTSRLYCRSVSALAERYTLWKWGRWEKPGYDCHSIDEHSDPVLSAASWAAEAEQEPAWPVPPPALTSASCTLHQGCCPCPQLEAKENMPPKGRKVSSSVAYSLQSLFMTVTILGVFLEFVFKHIINGNGSSQKYHFNALCL